MNDTHPTLTVAELMRLLMDEYNLEWDEAWDITTHACAYTNHTIMSEALENGQLNYSQDYFQDVIRLLKKSTEDFVLKSKTNTLEIMIKLLRWQLSMMVRLRWLILQFVQVSQLTV